MYQYAPLSNTVSEFDFISETQVALHSRINVIHPESKRGPYEYDQISVKYQFIAYKFYMVMAKSI